MIKDRYDVVICGGGLAGLTLARQLKRTSPPNSVLIIERSRKDIPDAAYKVGEATVEGGAHYYTEELGLTGYFNKHHLHKLGLRLFFGDSQGPMEARPELGARRFPRVPSYQIDRGILERDLRRMARELGADLIEEARVRDVDIRSGDDHVVHYQCQSDASDQTVRARFVVDASGRHRLLQRKLGLQEDSGHHINAAWWRFRGEYDVEKMAAPLNPQWSPKTQERKWFSTNHLMGRGYWVWMIPLSSGNTSIGLVADDALHPFATYDTEVRAREWLREHEPRLSEFLAGAEVLDFLKLRHCSYGSRQVFSHERWSCVGEAGVFLDAFYSPGSDFIAYTNSITTKLIQLDRRGALTPKISDTFNHLLLKSLWLNYIQVFRGNYAMFGTAPVMFTKVIWDTSYYWALPTQLLFRKLIAEPEAAEEYRPIAERFHAIQCRMQQCFRDWATYARSPNSYIFNDYSKTPICAELHLDLLKEKNADQCFRDMRRNVDRLEDWCESLAKQVYGSPARVSTQMVQA
jgi:flavin-dependent dehydrogenase